MVVPGGTSSESLGPTEQILDPEVRMAPFAISSNGVRIRDARRRERQLGEFDWARITSTVRCVFQQTCLCPSRDTAAYLRQAYLQPAAPSFDSPRSARTTL